MVIPRTFFWPTSHQQTMTTGTLSIGQQDTATGEAARADRIALTLFGLLAAYSVVYLIVLADKFQV